MQLLGHDGQGDSDHQEIDVELGISVEGELIIVSFTFDVTDDDAVEVAQAMCDEYKVPEQAKSVAATLKNIQMSYLRSILPGSSEGGATPSLDQPMPGAVAGASAGVASGAFASAATASSSSPANAPVAAQKWAAAEQLPAAAAAASAEEVVLGSSDPGARARLQTKLKAGLKYEDGRLQRLENNRRTLLEEEKQRRLKHEKDMADIDKKIAKEKKLVEDKRAKIINEWKEEEERGVTTTTTTTTIAPPPPAAVAASAVPLGSAAAGDGGLFVDNAASTGAGGGGGGGGGGSPKELPNADNSAAQ